MKASNRDEVQGNMRTEADQMLSKIDPALQFGVLLALFLLIPLICLIKQKNKFAVFLDGRRVCSSYHTPYPWKGISSVGLRVFPC